LLSQRLRNFIQSVVYLPHFISWCPITIFQQCSAAPGAQQFSRP